MITIFLALSASTSTGVTAYPPPSTVPNAVFVEQDGIVAVEAEHFQRQSMNSVRAWYINDATRRPIVRPDHDAAPYEDASNSAYVEALPDLFHEETDPIIMKENLGADGSTAILHYRIRFQTPGTYHVWTRLRSNDQEDNTIQVGINGTWPATAHILQSPVNHKKWIWKSDNRISRKPWEIGRATIEVPTAGLHDIQFTMREDGEEFDRFILALDPAYTPEPGLGPKTRLAKGRLPKPGKANTGQTALPPPLRNPDGAIYGANVVYQLSGDAVAAEAEDFYRQSMTDTRMWHLTTERQAPAIGPDSDAVRIDGASGSAYLELLPDLRQKDEDKMHNASSIYQLGGKAAVLTYMVQFKNPGRYYVWLRARAHDGDDNTLHVGLNDQWPESGKKMTFQGRNWNWSNMQRDTKAPISIDVPVAGIHRLHLSMREDGAEIDRLVITAKLGMIAQELDAVPAEIKGSIASWHNARESLFAIKHVARPEKDVILIETESMPASEGWKYYADKNGHTGPGWLEWTQPGQGSKAGAGLLTYDFEIAEDGIYQILLRGRMRDPTNRPETLDADGNDIWMKVEGGSDVPKAAAWKEGWNKIAILGHPEGWSWNSNLDQGAPHPITPVLRQFCKGQYRLWLSGRSEGYGIDQIKIVRVGKKPITKFD
jgi:Gylcosyl hydrolase family 115 C-terminal domain